jgi:nitrous oxidase accessory protein
VVRLVVAALLIVAAGALVASVRWPYWRMRIAAPQYPKGLHLIVYADRIEGDVREIDMLNHYIGMKPLDQGAQTERLIAIPAIAATAGVLLLVAAAAWRWRWVVWLALPSLLIAPGFAADLHWWMRTFGLHLNPKAPLSSAVKPFVPPLFGAGKIAQFDVVAAFGVGFWLAAAAGVLAAVAIWLRWRGGRDGLRRIGAAVAAACVLAGGGSASAQTLVADAAAGHDLAAVLAAAQDGDEVIVRGTHAGPIVVRRSVQLRGEDGAVIDGGGRGTVVTLAAPGIGLRGLTVRGSGDVLSAEDTGILATAPDIVIEHNRVEDVLFGVHVRHAPRSRVAGNVILGKRLDVPRRGDAVRVWYSDDVVLEDNRVLDSRDVVLWFSRGLTVRGNTIERGRYGLHFMYCHDALVEGNRLSGNSVGVYLMYSEGLTVRDNRIIGNRGPSGYGVGLKDMAGVRVEGNLIADNRAGIFLEHASGEFRDNVVAANDVGLWVWPSAQGNTFAGNSLVDNGEQVSAQGGGVPASNRWAGNFWSDYRGYDVDGDGAGDVPYRPMRLFERLTERYPALRFYADTPAAQAIELAARLLPIFAPQPVLVDPSPRMRPSLPRRVAAAGILG